MNRIPRLVTAHLACITVLAGFGGIAEAGHLEKIWDFKPNAPTGKNTSEPLGIYGLGFSPDGAAIAAVVGRSWREESVLVLDAKAPLSSPRVFDVSPKFWEWEPVFTKRIGWSPSGQQIIVRNIIISVSNGQTCSLPDSFYYLIRGGLVGRLFQPLRLSSFDLECNLTHTWDESQVEISDSSSSPEQDMLCVTRTSPSGFATFELIDWRSRSVMRRLPQPFLHAKFVDDGNAVCGVTGKPWHRTIECLSIRTGASLGSSAEWRSPDIRTALRSPRIIVSDHSRKLDFIDWFWYPGRLSKRVVWDLRSKKRVAAWKPRTQRLFTGDFPNDTVGQRQPYRFDISPDGDYVVEGGSGLISLYRIAP